MEVSQEACVLAINTARFSLSIQSSVEMPLQVQVLGFTGNSNQLVCFVSILNSIASDQDFV